MSSNFYQVWNGINIRTIAQAKRNKAKGLGLQLDVKRTNGLSA